MKSNDHKPTCLPGFSVLVEDSPDGSILKLLRDQKLHIPWRQRVRHMLCVGKPGSGKTTGLVLPMCFADIEDTERTVVVLDAQASEVSRIIEHAKKVRGPKAKILYFNPQDPKYSIRWNPVSGLWTIRETTDIANTMSAAISAGKHDSRYFRMQGVKYFAALIRAQNEVTQGKATGGDLHKIVDKGHKAIAELGHRSGVQVLESFAANLALGNHNDQTTLCELANLLSGWSDEKVDETTCEDEFDFGVLDDEPCVLIFALPEESVERMRPLTNAFLHRFFNFVMSRGHENGGELRRPVTLYIDEFASAVGRIPEFQQRANTLRKRGLAILAAVQTLAQIHEVYQEAGPSLLAAFNHLVMVPSVSYDDAVYASTRSGQMMTEEVVTSDGHTPINVHSTKRAVLTPDEICNPPRVDELGGPRMTFLFADLPPFQGWLKPTYQRPEYQDLMNKQSSTDLPLQRRRSHQPTHKISGIAHAVPKPALTNVTKLSNTQIRERLLCLQEDLGWRNAESVAKKWWSDFVAKNAANLGPVLSLAEELLFRKATISDFLDACIASETNDIQANLYFLDYLLRARECAQQRKKAA